MEADPRKEVSEDDPHLFRFMVGAKQLVSQYPLSIMGDSLHVDKGKRFYIVRGVIRDQPSFPNGYTFARIEIATGEIFSQSGKKAVGTIFSEHDGLEYIDYYGVIVNSAARQRRMQSFIVTTREEEIGRELREIGDSRARIVRAMGML